MPQDRDEHANLGGDYARDTHREGYGDDYARDDDEKIASDDVDDDVKIGKTSE